MKKEKKKLAVLGDMLKAKPRLFIVIGSLLIIGIVGATAVAQSATNGLGNVFNVSGSGAIFNFAGTPAGEDMAFGASQDEETDWISGHFTDDLDVDDDLNVDGDAVIDGTLQIDGIVTAPYLDGIARGTITSASTSTQVICSIRNESGSPRTLKNVYAVFGATSKATANADLFTFTLSPINTATGTIVGTDLLYGNSLTFSAASTTVTATSTLISTSYGLQQWYDDDYITLRVTSPTSTSPYSGYCYAEFSTP